MRVEEKSPLPFYADKNDHGRVVAESIQVHFESDPKPQNKDSKDPIYLVNIPMNGADPRLDPLRLLGKIQDEIFYSANASSKENLARLTVVIGINRRCSLVDETPIKALSQEEKSKINALPFHVVILHFYWKPSFSFTQEGLKAIQAEYLDSFQMAKSWCENNPEQISEVRAYEKESIKNTMVPYGEIRNAIATYHATQFAGFKLRNRFKTSDLYFLMLDADVKSLRLKNGVGLLSYFENHLNGKLRNQKPTLFAGGFRIGQNEGFMHSRFADLVLEIQHKTAEILPLGIYYSETNCLIYLPPNSHSLLEPFSPQQGEIKGLIKHLSKREKPLFIFDSQASIITTLPDRMKTEFSGSEYRGKFHGWDFSDITHLRGMAQSPLQPLEWAHRIYDALPKINRSEKTENRTSVSSLLSKLFSLTDPFSILHNSCKNAPASSYYTVIAELKRIVDSSQKHSKLKDFVEDPDEFQTKLQTFSKMYGEQLCETLTRVLNVTRLSITRFISDFFCLDPEKNIAFSAQKALQDLDTDSLENTYKTILKEIESGAFSLQYLNSPLSQNLSPMMILVAFDDLETLQHILKTRKWKELPNKAIGPQGLTPFRLALRKGCVDIAALYLLKKPNLIKEIDANTLMSRDQWGRSLLQALATMDKEGKVFEAFLEKCLRHHEWKLDLCDYFGNSVLDTLVEKGMRDRALKFLQKLHASRPHYFTETHAALIESRPVDLNTAIENRRQGGVSLLDLAILVENIPLAQNLITDYQEPPAEALDQENLYHLTSMETCFYLLSKSSTKLWDLFPSLLKKSSHRIFLLLNSQGQNIFHLCAQEESLDLFNLLWKRFSELVCVLEPHLKEDQSLYYYQCNSSEFHFLLSSPDHNNKSPFTYLIEGFIRKKQIHHELFSKFMIFENMKGKSSENEEDSPTETFPQGIPLLFSKQALFGRDDLDFAIRSSLSLDPEFASAVFRWENQNATYLSILIQNGFELSPDLFRLMDFSALPQESPKLSRLINALSNPAGSSWQRDYPQFKALYLEAVQNCQEEDLADDCFDLEDGEDEYFPKNRSSRFEIDDSDPEYFPSSEEDKQEDELESPTPASKKREHSPDSSSLQEEVPLEQPISSSRKKAAVLTDFWKNVPSPSSSAPTAPPKPNLR